LTSEHDPDSVQVNQHQHAKYLVKGRLVQKCATHTDTHTHSTDCSIRTTKVVGSKAVRMSSILINSELR